MKILLLGFAKLKYMPYANFYLDNIDKKKNDVHLLYWNRDLNDEDLSGFEDITLHEFRLYQEDNVAQRSKIKSFLRYRRFAKKIIKSNHFDFVIVLHTMPAVLLNGVLCGRFKDKFIFDYRDSTYERFSFFKKLISRIIEHSRFSFTSSDGFRKFFSDRAQKKVHTTHNILEDSLAHREYEKSNSDKIRVAFWGFIREEETNRALIEKFSRDLRFELHYYGREQKIALALKAYASEISASNVFFHGEYSPVDRYEFVKNTDIIHNAYAANNMMLAMGNKYYDALMFYIPQICVQGSFMGGLCVDKGVGYVCDICDDGLTQKIYEQYTSRDADQFNRMCDDELNRVMTEYKDGANELKQLFG